MKTTPSGTLAAVRGDRVSGGAALLLITGLPAVGSAPARPDAAWAGTSGSPLAGPAGSFRAHTGSGSVSLKAADSGGG